MRAAIPRHPQGVALLLELGEPLLRHPQRAALHWDHVVLQLTAKFEESFPLPPPTACVKVDL